jgi:hypothetical protein
MYIQIKVGKIKLGSRKRQKSSLLLLRFDTSFEIGKLECSEVNRISEHFRHQLAIGDQLVMQLLQQLPSPSLLFAAIPVNQPFFISSSTTIDT